MLSLTDKNFSIEGYRQILFEKELSRMAYIPALIERQHIELWLNQILLIFL